MVGRQALDLLVGVRIPLSQPGFARSIYSVQLSEGLKAISRSCSQALSCMVEATCELLQAIAKGARPGRHASF